MKRTTLLAATALTATLLGGVAFADGNNSHGMKQGDKSGSAMMMQGDRQGMMDGKGMMQGDLGAFLLSEKLLEFEEKLEECGILTISDFKKLTKPRLKELGFSFGARQQLTKAIRAAQKRNSVARKTKKTVMNMSLRSKEMHLEAKKRATLHREITSKGIDIEAAADAATGISAPGEVGEDDAV